MTLTFSAHFDGSALVPDEPVELPMGQRLIITVAVAAPAAPFADLLQFAGDVPDAPRDFSSQADHYLYGTPKR